MIISHQHRFVFVKTRKTAGTSIEVLLGKIAGPDAVVTPIDPPVAGHNPRNYRIARSKPRRLASWVRHPTRDPRRLPEYYNHMTARGIRSYLGAERWDSYYKFCFERNPWEKAVSRYYFAKGRGEFDGTFREFVLTAGDLPSDFDIYSIDGANVAVDFVGRYEHLADDLRQVLDRLGIDQEVSLSREKGNFRPADATVDTMFDDEMSARIEAAFAREIRAFGYSAPQALISPPLAEDATGA